MMRTKMRMTLMNLWLKGSQNEKHQQPTSPNANRGTNTPMPTVQMPPTPTPLLMSTTDTPMPSVPMTTMHRPMATQHKCHQQHQCQLTNMPAPVKQRTHQGYDEHTNTPVANTVLANPSMNTCQVHICAWHSC